MRQPTLKIMKNSIVLDLSFLKMSLILEQAKVLVNGKDKLSRISPQPKIIDV